MDDEPLVVIEDVTESEDVEDDDEPTGAGVGLDAFLVHPSAPALSSSSTLSPMLPLSILG